MIALSLISPVAVLLLSALIGTKKMMKPTSSTSISSSPIITNDENPAIIYLTDEQRQALLSSNDNNDNDNLTFPTELASQIKEIYDREGYVLLRNLIDPTLLKQAQRVTRQIISGMNIGKDVLKTGSSFENLKFGSVLSYNENVRDADTAFRKVALDSAIPSFIAKVLFQYSHSTSTSLSSKDNEQTVRVINDAFLIKSGKEPSSCGWHVDDAVFWPCSAHKPSSSLPDGINAWIALDDIPTETYGGGMYIAPRSHTGSATSKGWFASLGSSAAKGWIYKAYEAIGSTKTYPQAGYATMDELTKSANGQTCELASLDPSLNAKFEERAITFDYKAGDVLLMNRWLWHRSANLNEAGKKYYAKRMSMFPRYTVRYESGETRLPNGVSFHPSIFYDEANAGKTLNEICDGSGLPFFPKAWSSSVASGETAVYSEVENMKELVVDVMPDVQKKRSVAIRQLMQEVIKKNQEKAAKKAEDGEKKYAVE